MDRVRGSFRRDDNTALTKAPLFERFDAADVRALIEAYPLAWVCAGSAAALEASLLPLVGVFDSNDRLIEIIGHLSRSNPLYTALSRDPWASFLFSGPNAYISPEHAGRRNWAPTWNFTQLTVAAEVTFDPELTEESLFVLLDAMESERTVPWKVEELGPRYEGMLERIIGFRARVSEVRGKFKLGQDEDERTLHAIIKALPDAETVSWMRRFNADR